MTRGSKRTSLIIPSLSPRSLLTISTQPRNPAVILVAKQRGCVLVAAGELARPACVQFVANETTCMIQRCQGAVRRHVQGRASGAFYVSPAGGFGTRPLPRVQRHAAAAPSRRDDQNRRRSAALSELHSCRTRAAHKQHQRFELRKRRSPSIPRLRRSTMSCLDRRASPSADAIASFAAVRLGWVT